MLSMRCFRRSCVDAKQPQLARLALRCLASFGAVAISSAVAIVAVILQAAIVQRLGAAARALRSALASLRIVLGAGASAACGGLNSAALRTTMSLLADRAGVCMQSLMAGEEFQHILRVLNTNVDGKEKVMYAMTAIRGIGRRFANVVCKKAEVDMNKRCALLRYGVMTVPSLRLISSERLPPVAAPHVSFQICSQYNALLAASAYVVNMRISVGLTERYGELHGRASCICRGAPAELSGVLRSATPQGVVV